MVRSTSAKFLIRKSRICMIRARVNRPRSFLIRLFKDWCQMVFNLGNYSIRITFKHTTVRVLYCTYISGLFITRGHIWPKDLPSSHQTTTTFFDNWWLFIPPMEQQQIMSFRLLIQEQSFCFSNFLQVRIGITRIKRFPVLFPTDVDTGILEPSWEEVISASNVDS